MSDAFPIPGLDVATTPRAPAARRGPSRRGAARRASTSRSGPPSCTPGAPLLVVAGAGSGKTRVLTRRIAWLISERRAHPGSILAITFTNKAAAEMKERVEDLVGRRARIMWVSTFHSACVRILRKEIDKLGYKSSFSIYDAADSKRLMTLVLRDLDLDPQRYQPGPLSCTGSRTRRTSCATPRTPPRTPATTSRRPTPRRTRSTSAGSARPTPSTSTT